MSNRISRTTARRFRPGIPFLSWGGVFPALLAVLAVVAGSPVGADLQAAELSFSPQEGNFDCGMIYRVELQVDAAVTDLRGFSLVLQYDPLILTPWSVGAGSLMTGAGCSHFFTWLNPGAVDGTIMVDAATLGCSMVGPGAIVVLEFEGEVQGISDLDCIQGELRTGSNDPIPFTCIPGTVDYRCPVPETRVPWGSIKAEFERR
ncbi:cohesin domain-containing protein [bacterium]|nr:cohesin domain-containing protein [bacterium]